MAELISGDNLERCELQCLLDALYSAVSDLGERIRLKNGGDFSEIVTAIENIFCHGYRILQADGSPDLVYFFENFDRILYYQSESESFEDSLVSGREWIEQNLEKNNLSQCVNVLLSDERYTESCYEEKAFLRSDKHIQAMLCCLDFVESDAFADHLGGSVCQQGTSGGDNGVADGDNGPQSGFPLTTKQSQLESIVTIESQLKSTDKMGNKNSLKVNYDQISKSVDQINVPSTEGEELRQRRRHMLKELRKTKSSRRLTQNEEEPSEEDLSDCQLRPSKSLPDFQVHEQPEEVQEADKSVKLSNIRERSRTISQPIRIPNRTPRLTEENLARKAIMESNSFAEQMKTPESSSSHNNSKPNPNPTILTPIEIVRCDDIEIHTDVKFSANSPSFNNCNVPFHRVPSFAYSPMSPQNSLASMIATPSKKIKHFHDSDFFRGSYSGGDKYGSAPEKFVNSFTPRQGQKIRRRYRKSSLGLEEVAKGQSVPTTTGWGFFPKPKPGQSLASFLQTAQFSKTNSELERENAHFSVCDAVIAAVEHLKWSHIVKKSNKKQKNTRKRRLKQWDSDFAQLNEPSSSRDYFSNIPSYSEDSSSSNESLKDPLNDESNLLSVSTLDLNDHTAYAEWGETSFDGLSAEGIGLSLISKFSDKQLPKASELFWNWPGSDMDNAINSPIQTNSRTPTVYSEDRSLRTFIRGTKDWAPPRAQLIFTRHPIPNRKRLLMQQDNRCAGCGMGVARAYSHLYRYCEYLGKMHCTGCHRNQISVIPARVLDKWDFTCYPVSNFSYRLLDQIWSNPLFRVPDLSPHLYYRVKSLYYAREKRRHLNFIKEFIMSCRFAEEEKTIFDDIPPHNTDDIDLWSMSDFVDVKQGSYKRELHIIIAKCEKHILKCELCLARGFVCELCTRNDVIFPWQPRIKRCLKCGSCVHELCNRNQEQCRKCQRLEHRHE